MRAHSIRVYYLATFALLVALLLTFSPNNARSTYAASAPWKGTITSWSNVRSAPNTHASVLTTAAPGSTVTVYATVAGESLWSGSNWYRVSDLSAAPRFVYSGLVVTSSNPGNGGGSPPPPASGKTGSVNSWANVRYSPNTSSGIATTYAPGTTVTIYASVAGESLWSGNLWYKVSNNPTLYVYSALVSNSNGGNGGGAPSAQGKLIVISLSSQWMHVYDNGKDVYNSAITSGRPTLPTPTGTYHIFYKVSPTTFYSPWPPGDPNWYAPTHINYAMEWKEGGFFLHDSSWRSVYGPGTNVWHYDPAGGWMDGTHGCVTMPNDAIKWLYNWATVGTTVQINN